MNRRSSRRRSRSALPFALPEFRKVSLQRLAIVAVLGLGATWLALALAVSGAKRTQNPALALRFMPHESTALASRADQLLLAKPEDPPQEARTLALDALRQQPLNPRALRVAGYLASAKGDENTARALIGLAASQSRRDALTQFFLIEDAVQRQDVKTALVHYDIALRTKLSAYDTLFPVLLGAIGDPAIRTALSPYIRANQAWARAFLSYANLNSKDLPTLVALILESGGLADPQAAHEQDVGLLGRLVHDRLFTDARRLYLHMPGASDARLGRIGFDASDQSGQFGAMGWQVSTEPESGSSFSTGIDHRVSMSLLANAGTFASVATKILYLKPGRYAFEAQLSSIDAGDGGFIRWQLRCARPDGDKAVWALDSSAKVTKAMVSVPNDCPVQFFDIVASGGNSQSGMEATVASLTLRR